MKVIEEGKKHLMRCDCHYCESKLEYSRADVLQPNTDPFIECPVCSEAIALMPDLFECSARQY